ncbi:MAG: AAA family ATPase, partial [Kiritimatiellae bacterium]|nr:AAA family ATPase [Kiritimatiellia bacterium]
MSHRSAAYFLVGPTASGKTAVAEALARRTGAFVLSADSMLVYRGMDVGTAKPGPDERAEGRLRGIDLADPDESFSVGKWLAAAASAFAEAEAAGRDVIVAGGTGLYVGALIHGLDAPPASAAARAEAEAALASGGIAALAERIEAMSPGATADIDRTN